MTQSPPKPSLHNRTLLGVLFMLFGLALYCFSDAFVKHLMGTYSVPQANFLRSATRLVPLLIAAQFQGGLFRILKTNYPKQHAIRLAVNLLYTYCFMFAFSMGSLTNVYTLSYTSPLFMVLLSAGMLKETVTKERWLAVGVGLLGVLIALQPGSGVFQITAILVLCGTFLGALNKILIRRLSITEHSLAITIYPNIMMMLVTFPFLIGSWQSMPLNDWLLFGVVGVITATGQYLIAQALRYAQGSILAPIDYSTLFWAVGLDYLWWNKTIEWSTLLGAFVIIGSNLYILYYARREEVSTKS